MGKYTFDDKNVIIRKMFLGNLKNPSISLIEIQWNDLVELETIHSRPYEPAKVKK